MPSSKGGVKRVVSAKKKLKVKKKKKVKKPHVETDIFSPGGTRTIPSPNQLRKADPFSTIFTPQNFNAPEIVKFDVSREYEGDFLIEDFTPSHAAEKKSEASSTPFQEENEKNNINLKTDESVDFLSDLEDIESHMGDEDLIEAIEEEKSEMNNNDNSNFGTSADYTGDYSGEESNEENDEESDSDILVAKSHIQRALAGQNRSKKSAYTSPTHPKNIFLKNKKKKEEKQKEIQKEEEKPENNFEYAPSVVSSTENMDKLEKKDDQNETYNNDKNKQDYSDKEREIFQMKESPPEKDQDASIVPPTAIQEEKPTKIETRLEKPTERTVKIDIKSPQDEKYAINDTSDSENPEKQEIIPGADGVPIIGTRFASQPAEETEYKEKQQNQLPLIAKNIRKVEITKKNSSSNFTTPLLSINRKKSEVGTSRTVKNEDKQTKPATPTEPFNLLPYHPSKSEVLDFKKHKIDLKFLTLLEDKNFETMVNKLTYQSKKMQNENSFGSSNNVFSQNKNSTSSSNFFGSGDNLHGEDFTFEHKYVDTFNKVHGVQLSEDSKKDINIPLKKNQISLFLLFPDNEKEEKQKFLSGLIKNPCFKYKSNAACQRYIKLWGKPHTKYMKEAIQILDAIKRKYGSLTRYFKATQGPPLTSQQSLNYIRYSLLINNVHKQSSIRLEQKLASQTCCKGTELVVRLPVKYHMNTLQGICNHEISTHLLRTINERKQIWNKNRKKFKLKNYLETEEGLATIHTYLDCKNKYLGKAALHYYAAATGYFKNFGELFDDLAKFIDDPQERWDECVRVKRGILNQSEPGSVSKDQAYLIGAIDILNNMENIDLRLLYCGKVALEDCERLQPITKDFQIPYFMENFEEYKAKLKKIKAANFI